MTYDGWRDGTADAIRAEGVDYSVPHDATKGPRPSKYGARAAAFAMCGRNGWVQHCGPCGEAMAAVTVMASCGMRCCPTCARHGARERVDRVSAACPNVAPYTRARGPDVEAELQAEIEQSARAVAQWSRYAQSAARAGDDTRAVAHHAAADAAEARHRAAVWQLHRARERERTWGWKLITVSPRWDTLDPEAVTVEGLQRRIKIGWEHWYRLWDGGLRVGATKHQALASAHASMELSSHAHVHIHALYYGPWVTAAWMQKTAGCIVDVRAVEVPPGLEVSAADAWKYALKEAIKYTAKLPTPTSPGWYAGEKREVLRPVLAARWMIATHGRQLSRSFGPLRDAMAALPDEPAGEEREGAVCWRCGALVTTQALPMPLKRVALTLGPQFRGVVRIRLDLA